MSPPVRRMLLGWMVSAALMYAIIPGLEFLPALVIAAGVTPTDPILASSGELSMGHKLLLSVHRSLLSVSSGWKG